MNSKNFLLRKSLRIVLLVMCLLPLSSCAKEEKGPVSVVIYNHTDKGIMATVDDGIGGDVGPHGGGGSIMCCVMIPAKWRSDLTATIQWSTGMTLEDWEPTQTVTVPIPEYDHEMGDFQIHILRGGKVRVIVSPYTLQSEQHPLRLEGNPDADL